METKNLKQTIAYYIGSFQNDSDKNTQFYEACAIARLALEEVDKLNTLLVEHGINIDKQ